MPALDLSPLLHEGSPQLCSSLPIPSRKDRTALRRNHVCPSGLPRVGIFQTTLGPPSRAAGEPEGSSPDPEVLGCPAPVPQTGHACWKTRPPQLGASSSVALIPLRPLAALPWSRGRGRGHTPSWEAALGMGGGEVTPVAGAQNWPLGRNSWAASLGTVQGWGS